jgi:hypothetical protein
LAKTVHSSLRIPIFEVGQALSREHGYAGPIHVELWSEQGEPLREECRLIETESEAVAHYEKLVKTNPGKYVRVLIPGSRADVLSESFSVPGNHSSRHFLWDDGHGLLALLATFILQTQENRLVAGFNLAQKNNPGALSDTREIPNRPSAEGQ